MKILITGGGGYVGSALVPSLLAADHDVTVVDTFWYGKEVMPVHPNLRLVEADIRDSERMMAEMAGIDAVIHLACISNDPSFELDPGLGKTINYDAFSGLLDAAVANRVKRFVYASSSSIYGVKETPDVREDDEPLPLTDYSQFKLDCERDLLAHRNPHKMTRIIVRPSTVCGYAPRLRLDLVVNILTIHALVNKRIRVFGGSQLRPNLNVEDMVRAYHLFLDAPHELVDGEAFNVGYQNYPVGELAEIVKRTLGDDSIEIITEASDDIRSYHVNSDKIRERLGFVPEHTIEDAVTSLAEAYGVGRIPAPFGTTSYSNIKRMQELAIR